VRLLLDTHAFLWEVEGNRRLPRRVRDVIEDPRNVVCLSVASVWEMGTKARSGRLRIARPIETLIQDAIMDFRLRVLAVELRHALRLVELAPLHADPFDRMLVAQAIEERLTLVTRDPTLHSYPVDHLW
jgi:PIN domain nuclease of toxin-antitoxin system